MAENEAKQRFRAAQARANNYEASHQHDFDELMTLYVATFAQRIDDPDDRELALSTAALVITQISDVYECVRIFVGCELDAATPGTRGLGRLSPESYPRPGGYFRSELRPAAVTAIGSCLERAVIIGFATSVLVETFQDQPRPFRVPPIENLFSDWVPRIVASTTSLSGDISGVAFAIADDPFQEYEEVLKEQRIVRGLRANKKKAVATGAYYLCIGAGIALHEGCLSRD